MKSYIEETLDFIESDEMRNYLRGCQETFTDKRPGVAGRTCAEIVSCAPASIERKIPALELIAAQTQPDPEWDYLDPAKIARECRIALDERYNTPPGTMFWLQDWCYHKRGRYFGDAFFTDFDAAVRYAGEMHSKYGDPEDAEFLSFTIEKLVPGEDGNADECCIWTLNAACEIWYFNYIGSKYEPEGWDGVGDCTGASLYLPVPFAPGDIILADCRPFSTERHVLILDIGDNQDCCSVQCLYMLPTGKLGCGAFKHNSFHALRENSHVSGAYRARLWHDDLPENEAPLATLSVAVKANPALGRKILDWFHLRSSYDEDYKDDRFGAKWQPLKEAFEL